MGHSLSLNRKADGEKVVLGDDKRLNGYSVGIEPRRLEGEPVV